MGVFRWREEFETGLPEVDEGHRKLVAIIDEIGLVAQDHNPPDADEVLALLQRLRGFARMYFGDEEALMERVGCDGRHFERHRGEHAAFARQLGAISQAGGFDTDASLMALQAYLHGWFAYHACGLDQSMARQIFAIREGALPEQAFEADGGGQSEAATVLLDALGNMVRQVGSRNLALAEADESLRRANRTLEANVQARTRELEQRNAELRESLGELEEAQHQLMQSERMASIGQLAAGVAHEINNPIGFVNSNLGTLNRYVGDVLKLLDVYRVEEAALGPEARERVRQACEAADLEYLREDIVDLVRESREGLERVTGIIQDLKEFSHVDDGKWQHVDLAKGLESTLNVVWNELKYKARVIREYGELPLVMCRPGQVNQVFMNLLVNAAHAIETSGKIWLRTGIEGERVWVEIEDSGCGMSEEVRRRIFDPFFTTKPVGQGTGLGLPLSFGIVKKHRGHIAVHSTLGQGTRFRVWLPITQHEDEDGMRAVSA